MPIASPEIYNEMLDRAKAGGFAYPAINCTSLQTINAALRGFERRGWITVGNRRMLVVEESALTRFASS